ncbi:uncharacterized protein LOC130779170 [Actinidia eriantha]|uniref:uncharacterized protein LOC130779170 n=1 Tax=Actinidia eriantha TaxID=165200 RepID=UPI002590D210|nr:uncharacterized protein LOC130779170 [Actinidia eriantha]
MMKRVTKLATPTFALIHALQYQWLAFLAFADDHILAVENLIVTLFPPSTHLFDKIDEFVCVAETLPGKFDDAVNKCPTVIDQVPFLDWALVCLISWLNFWISILTHWGSDNTREKEITVDINCNNHTKELESAQNVYSDFESSSHIQSENVEKSSLQDELETINHERHPTDAPCENVVIESPISDSSENKTNTIQMTVKLDVVKCSYKEMLEKGKKDLKFSYKEMLEKGKKAKENTEKKEDGFKKVSPKAVTRGREATEGNKKDENGSTKALERRILF